jgi:chorismate mutase/prephenate dehydratase
MRSTRSLSRLLNQRAAVALEVGEVKKHFNAPVFRPEREQQVIARLQDMSNGPLASEHISAIWREIMAASRALEKTITAAYLGPVGTYSEQAMHEYFGQSIEGLPCPSIDEVFRSVEAGAAEFGVVPVENSTEGAVSRTLDLLLQTQLLIGGELALPIHHNLLTLNGELTGVTRVCAHAQALAQCQRWLRPTRRISSARRCRATLKGASCRGDPTVRRSPAIARRRTTACRWHALIQDDPHNRTRFVMIGKEPTGVSGMTEPR